jgi:hypothetical protein
MAMMRRARLGVIQTTTSVSTQTIETEMKNVEEGPLPHPEGPPTRFTAFRDAVLANITQNQDRKPEARRYEQDTNDFGFILRSMGPTAYETARKVIPMQNINRLDILYKEEIDLVEGAISKLEFLPTLLQHYLKTYISGRYLKGPGILFFPGLWA